VIGFGSGYLNEPSIALGCLSVAVYPVYIVHLTVRFVFAHFLLPLSLPAYLKLVLMLFGTFGACLLLYEVFGRIKWIGHLFGRKLNTG
jgi:hypothetical protein